MLGAQYTLLLFPWEDPLWRSLQTHHGRTYSPGHPLAPWLPPPPPLYPQSHLQSPWSSHTLALPPRTRDTQASTVTPPRRKSCSTVGIPAWQLSPPQRCPFSRTHVCVPLESSTDRHAAVCVPRTEWFTPQPETVTPMCLLRPQDTQKNPS